MIMSTFKSRTLETGTRVFCSTNFFQFLKKTSAVSRIYFYNVHYYIVGYYYIVELTLHRLTSRYGLLECILTSSSWRRMGAVTGVTNAQCDWFWLRITVKPLSIQKILRCIPSNSMPRCTTRWYGRSGSLFFSNVLIFLHPLFCRTHIIIYTSTQLPLLFMKSQDRTLAYFRLSFFGKRLH